MVSLKVNIHKKDLWLLSAIVVFLVGVAYVIAYNPNWQTSPGNPAVMGHTPDEIEGGGWVHSGAVIFSGDCPSNWTSLNTGIGKRTLVMLKVENNQATSHVMYDFKPKGESRNLGPTGSYSGQVSSAFVFASDIGYFMVETDANGELEWRGTPPSLATAITLMGYLNSGGGSGTGGAQIKTGTYTGNDGIQEINVGFMPDSVTFINHGSSWVSHKTKYMPSAYAKYADAYADNLVSLTTNGFRLESGQSSFNGNGQTYSYTAMKDG
ncbi:MAG: hypothetical protein PHH54_04880 [Candidatus Nanoarchaeia archaeon]|nr:hypothetical protein [Candidatus Nanoarchaeia archaeon]MDD5741292.1 hypothetical protein [Candidatus Nanoarchaeia archaeon]